MNISLSFGFKMQFFSTPNLSIGHSCVTLCVVFHLYLCERLGLSIFNLYQHIK